MDAALEIAVAGEHRGHGQVGLHDGFLDGFGQRAGVANAGGAAIPHQVEAQCIEVRCQPSCFIVVGHHFGAGRQRTLDPGFALQAFFHGLFRHQPGGHHHAGV
ncbi:hypothetical protein D3C80_1733260 [compost metagenome]